MRATVPAVSLQFICKRLRILAVPTAFALLLTSCDTPDEVGTFCTASVATAASAQKLFGDMRQSCLREVNTRTELATFKPEIETNAGCTAIGNQADGAAAAAQVLSDYFSAIGALASFGSAQAGTDAQTQVAAATATFPNPATQSALGSIAQFLVSTATAGYQAKELDKDLNAVNTNVSTVVKALITVIQDDYVGRQLKSEEQKIGDQYQEFAKSSSPEAKLMLDDRWREDERRLQSKRDAAKSLVAGLQTIAAGVSNLAANAHTLKAKEIPGMIAPYVTQLQALIPEIRTAF